MNIESSIWLRIRNFDVFWLVSQYNHDIDDSKLIILKKRLPRFSLKWLIIRILGKNCMPFARIKIRLIVILSSWANDMNFFPKYSYSKSFSWKAGNCKLPWNYHHIHECWLSSWPGSFASTKWVVNDRSNTNSTQFQFCTKTAKTTCFSNEKLNISGYMAALNLCPGSFVSTKWVLNDRSNTNSIQLQFCTETAKTTCFLTEILNISG
jgi:hypothetical protein